MMNSIRNLVQAVIIVLAAMGLRDILSSNMSVNSEGQVFLPAVASPGRHDDEIMERLEALEALLDGVSRDGNTLLVSGLNLQVVSGTGATDAEPNGLGNVIIGYDEPRAGDESEKSGSHMLVLGAGNSYSGFGGVIAGQGNTLAADFGAILGGTRNEVLDVFGVVVGGNTNVSNGLRSIVIGGQGNRAEGEAAVVVGGLLNRASGQFSFIGGGNGNQAGAVSSSVSGGSGNWAAGEGTSILGGQGNLAAGPFSTIGGGMGNRANGPSSMVSGGRGRITSGESDWAAGELYEDE